MLKQRIGKKNTHIKACINDIVETHEYIAKSWERAVVEPQKEGERFYLPHPFVPPCITGLFRTLFYWDTYFTNKGLIIDGKINLAKNNVDDLFFMLDKMGYVPNAWSESGTKFCSQPPYLYLMVSDIYAVTNDKMWLKKAYFKLKSEYSFWQSKRSTPLTLNRYYHQPLTDKALIAYYDYVANERIAINKSVSKKQKIAIAHNLIAVAESGMDWTPRFAFSAADIIPVDLNALLYGLERYLSELARDFEPDAADEFQKAYSERKSLMDKYMLDGDVYYDYNYVAKKRSEIKFSGQFLPYILGLSNSESGAINLLDSLFYKYGVVSTENINDDLSYQWSYPNSWAPDNFFAFEAMRILGLDDKAKIIGQVYLSNVALTFSETDALWEKYDGVVGGAATKTEHAMTEMLGWTGGVFQYIYSLLIKQD